MISLSHTLVGDFAHFGPQIHEAAADIVRAHLHDFLADVRQSFEAPKSGATYRRDDGSPYTASAPGEPPAVKEGDLWLSVETAMADDLTGVAWTDDPKAARLNYGDGTLAARPFWEPAIDVRRPLFLADLADLEARLR